MIALFCCEKVLEKGACGDEEDGGKARGMRKKEGSRGCQGR
jgi:hypothetical protein